MCKMWIITIMQKIVMGHFNHCYSKHIQNNRDYQHPLFIRYSSLIGSLHLGLETVKCQVLVCALLLILCLLILALVTILFIKFIGKHCLYTSLHLHVYTHMRVHTHTYIIHKHKHIQAPTHAHTHAGTHRHIHSHMH